MNGTDSRREALLADIELTRQQMCRAVHEARRGLSRRRIALLGALSMGVTLIWLYHALRRLRAGIGAGGG